MWSPRGVSLSSAFSLQRHIAPTAGVMVWAAIPYVTRLPLIFFYGHMTAQRYPRDNFQPLLLSLLAGLQGAIFQPDNDQPHTESVSQVYLHQITSLPWPIPLSDLPQFESICLPFRQQDGKPISLFGSEVCLFQLRKKTPWTSKETCMPYIPPVSHCENMLEMI